MPFPFLPAAPLTGDPETFGPIDDWLCEWLGNGLRAQAEKRAGKVEIWSHRGEKITARFPELAVALANTPGHWTLDGEIRAATPEILTARLRRPGHGPRYLARHPAQFVAFDLLRQGSRNLTPLPLRERRARLEKLLAPSKFVELSERIRPASWHEAAEIRAREALNGIPGLLLRRLDAPYAPHAGRSFAWREDPLTVDAVLTAASPLDYTFSVWKGRTLVPVARAFEGLSEKETHSLRAWILRHTLERHGDVLLLELGRVFSLGFDGLSESTAHIAGFTLRYPRILGERVDKSVREAGRVEDLAAVFRYLRSPTARKPDDHAN